MRACVCVYMCVPVRVCVIHNRTATRLRPHEPNRRIPSIPTTTNHDQQQIPNSRAVFERAMEELPDSERTEKVRTFIRAHVCMYVYVYHIDPSNDDRHRPSMRTPTHVHQPNRPTGVLGLRAVRGAAPRVRARARHLQGPSSRCVCWMYVVVVSLCASSTIARPTRLINRIKSINQPITAPTHNEPPRPKKQYALDTMPREKIPELYADFVQFEKKHGDRAAIEVRGAGG